MDKRKTPNIIYGMSPSGWIDHELFANWFLKLFIKNIPQTRSVLLLLDRHSSHYTIHLKVLRLQQKMILFFLSATKYNSQGSTTWCQLLGPLKIHWSNIYRIDTCLRTQERLSLNFSFLHFYMRHGFTQFNPKQSD